MKLIKLLLNDPIISGILVGAPIGVALGMILKKLFNN